MAQKSRSKELWLIPKRGSLHQTICLIDGILERNYDRTSWNAQKQNNLGVNLKNWGATKSGKNIAPQSIRTLVAGIPQYLGFLYINTNTTPSTICITDVGKILLNQHKADIVRVNNLVEGDAHLIKHSRIVLTQMEKLQLTNPIYLKDCENIFVFPFRITLKLLMKLGYLDREEIGYFLLRIKDESEFPLTIKEIDNFRKLKPEDRKDIIDAYKKTHFGNITLVQAPSAAYYELLCLSTGIIDRHLIKPSNLNKKISAIKIKDEFVHYADTIINQKYANVDTYNFTDNLDLWIEYFGNPKRLYPPIDINIVNKTNQSFLLKIIKESRIINVDLIENNSNIYFPMFIDEDYELVMIDIETGSEIAIEKFVPTRDRKQCVLSFSTNNKPKRKTLEQIGQDILAHSSCKSFCGEALNYLLILNKALDIDKTEDNYLRGAYYEYLFYQLLMRLKDADIISDVVWNGKIGKFGLPIPAPGGRTGTADIVFIIDNIHCVLELTTIKSKSGQGKAELASVPDHIRLYKDSSNKKVIGIFCAPVIHERNSVIMKSILEKHDISLKCVTDTNLVNVLTTKNREKILDFLLKD